MPDIQYGLMEALERNPALMRRARFLHLRFAVASGDERRLVTVSPGAVSVQPLQATDAGQAGFTIAASPAAWAEFSRPHPLPGFQDVIAMAESGNGEILGDDLLPFFGNLLLVKGVVAAMFKGEASW